MKVLLTALCAALPLLAQAAERAIEKDVVVNAPLAQTWAAWTTREGLVSFFAPDALVEPRVGGAFEMYFDPGAVPGSKGADGMRFLAVQPMKMLSFEWNAPPHLPEARAQRTLVIVRFAALNDHSTRVTLHHTGWGDGGQWDQAYNYFEGTWPRVLAGLKKRFDSGPNDWSGWLKQLEKMRAEAAGKAPGQTK